MKNICKGLVILCVLAGIFLFVPGNVQAAKLTMKNTDSKITLKYDDRYTFKNDVEEIKIISVKSNNVQTGKKDSEVLKLAEGSKNKVIASGCGKAVVKLKNGKKIGVKVKAAKISLLLLIGQSNMEPSLEVFAHITQCYGDAVFFLNQLAHGGTCPKHKA